MKFAFLAVATLLCASSSKISGLKKLNVVAVDSHGQPVTDLQASDFQVSEDGKTKEIAYFRFTGGKGSPLPPGSSEYSNRAGSPSYPTVILIDFMSDRVMSDSVIGKQVAEALKKLESSDDVYLYFLTNHGEISPIHALPGTGDETAHGAVPWGQNADQTMDLAIKKLSGLRPVDDFDPAIRFKLTVAALDALGGQMERIRGRKNLVWVTHGVPMNYKSYTGQPVDLSHQFQRLAEQLEQAQIAVYAVQQSTQGAGQQLATESSQTIDIFTHLTGGRSYGSDSVEAALSQARMDSRANYEIVYFTEASDTGDKHRKIRVVCKRKDVHLQTEQDYYALGLKASSTDFEKRAVQSAALSPLDAAEIGVRVKASPVGATQDIQFDLQIDAADLMLRQEQGHYTGKVDVVFVTYEGNQPKQATNPVPLNINLTAQQYQGADRAPLTFQETMGLDAKLQKVRAIVVDSERRAVGSVMIPIQH